MALGVLGVRLDFLYWFVYMIPIILRTGNGQQIPVPLVSRCLYHGAVVRFGECTFFVCLHWMMYYAQTSYNMKNNEYLSRYGLLRVGGYKTWKNHYGNSDTKLIVTVRVFSPGPLPRYDMKATPLVHGL
jgi:hypothetical protein